MDSTLNEGAIAEAFYATYFINYIIFFQLDRGRASWLFMGWKRQVVERTGVYEVRFFLEVANFTKMWK